MKSFSKKFFFGISLAMVFALFAGCKSTTPAPSATPSPSPPPAAVEAPPLKVTMPTTLPAMMGILRTRIYFTGSGYIPQEMVVVEMEVPAGVEITGVKPGERVGVAYTQADQNGNFTANVEAMTKITTFLRGSFLPTLAPDPKSFKPLPHGVYTFVASGVESGRSGVTKIEFVPPEKK
jgi:hypothetical protein